MVQRESPGEQFIELCELHLGRPHVGFQGSSALPGDGMVEYHPVLDNEEFLNHLVVELLGNDYVGVKELGFPVRHEARVVCLGYAYLLHEYLPIYLEEPCCGEICMWLCACTVPAHFI